MQRATRNNLILIGVIAILGAAALADQMRARLAAPKPLLAVEPRTIHEIVIECPDCPRRRLEKIGGRWQMAEPYALPADAARVDALLEIPKALVQHHYRETALEPAKVGLVPPFATVTFGPHRIEFGTTEPLRNERYAKLGAEIVLVQDRFSHLLRLAPEALLDTRPFAGSPPAKAKLDGHALDDAAIAKLAALRARRIAPGPPGARGRLLEVDLVDGHSVVFELVHYGDEWQLVRREPALGYALDTAAVDDLIAAAAPEAKP